MPRSRLDPADPSRMLFTCPQCGAGYRASMRLAGKLIRCRHCGGPCPIPSGVRQSPGQRLGLHMPARVAHARYLDLLEAHAGRPADAVAVDATDPPPRWRPLDRVLAAANVAVLLAILAIVVAVQGRPPTAVSAAGAAPAPQVDPANVAYVEVSF